VLRAALAAATVAGLVVPLCPDLPTLLGVRLVEGFALGGVPATAVTYLTEEVTRSAAAVAAGTYVSGTTLGGLFGRIVAAPIAELAGWRAGLLVVGVASALAAIGFALLAPASPKRGGVRSPSSRPAPRDLFAPRLLVLYAQAFLLMGGFVAVYNYLGFRLEQPPFSVRPGLTALLFLAYLAGTVSSRVAGTAAATAGRRPVLVASTALLAVGVLLTMPPVLPLVVVGLVLLTAGFFGAHAVAAGWVGARATAGRAQAASLYNVAYYAGSSLLGWAAGGAFLVTGWAGLALLVLALAVLAAGWALLDGRRTT
jgi:predicted MFS family arabinose efflux permease